jgi:hypothetical protein
MKPPRTAHGRGTEIYHLLAEFERAWTKIPYALLRALG